MMALHAFWLEDPAPYPPTEDTDSMAFWRWLSAETLRRRT